MATPKSLAEWQERIALLSGRIQLIRGAVTAVERVESTAGADGVVDWPIDLTANALMYHPLSALCTDLASLITASRMYKYCITEGRPSRYWHTTVISKVIEEASPRQYIMANADALPYRDCNPTLYGGAWTDHIAFLYDHPTDGSRLFSNRGAGYKVYGYAPCCPPTSSPTLIPNGRGIEIDALECLHPLNEVYDPGLSIDRGGFWSFGEGWTHQAGGHVNAYPWIIGGAGDPAECLVQESANMVNPTVANVIYEIAVCITPNVYHVNAAIDVLLEVADPPLVRDYALAIPNPGVDGAARIHLFYVVAGANNSPLVIRPVIARPQFYLEWIRMTPMIGQLICNGCFFSAENSHMAGDVAHYFGTDRWASTNVDASHPWNMAAGAYCAMPAAGSPTMDILYQRGSGSVGLTKVVMPVAIKDAPVRYVVEFSWAWDSADAAGHTLGIQPAIGEVDTTKLTGAVIPEMMDGAGYGDPVFPPDDAFWYRYKQIITSGISGDKNGLAFIPRELGATGPLDTALLGGAIKDVVMYEYTTEMQDDEEAPIQDYVTETTLVDRVAV